MRRRAKNRDDRDYDTTQLRESSDGIALKRDYSAHFFRWSFARRFIQPNHNVLEIGCGQDKPLARMLTCSGPTSRVNTYTGVDLNRVKPTKQKNVTIIGQFNFVERWKELRKLRPEGWDVVVHLEVIEHMKVEHGAKMLKACFELLKPGGVMLMSTPCYDGKRHAANHIHEYTVPELQKATEKAGFQVERRFGTFMDIKHIGKVQPVAGGAKGNQLEMDALFKDESLRSAVKLVADALSHYFDNDAISNIFGPLYPNHARNNLWVCRKGKK